MKMTNVALVVGFDNSVSAYGRADCTDMQPGIINITLEKCIALLVDSSAPGRSLPKEEVVLSEYTHSDGEVYLVGARPSASPDIDYGSVINFAKGDTSLPYRWL